jgi:hypothetical protein
MVVIVVVVVVVVELSTNPLSLPLSPEFYAVCLASWYTQTASWKGCYYHGTVAADRDFLPLS